MGCRWEAMASRRSSPSACPQDRSRSPRWPRSPEEPAAIVAPPVARDWSDLFITGEATGPDAPAPRSGEGDSGERIRRSGFLRRLRESMAKTRQALGSEIQATLFGALDET